MRTIAQSIAEHSDTADQVCRWADRVTGDVAHDCQTGEIIYSFSDGSRLTVSGPVWFDSDPLQVDGLQVDHLHTTAAA